ncbi:probable methyltransferase-like protein 24 [Astyanax mexicanus]|uniref:probable methyltransferase-like protein 24 n=1 Tax=Astyanax mexicanus TaxID=7994 RepID=UPI0020CB1E9B|nr:probable methyltransferase-like protein 24 [Astyanax mexicanus]
MQREGMATCRSGGLRGLVPRVFVFALSLLLLLQLMVSLAVLRSSPGPAEQPVFTVITIQGAVRPGESVRSAAAVLRGLENLPEDESAGLAADEEETELNPQQVTDREVVLQPWASEQPSFSTEVQRLTQFITTPEVNCSRWLGSVGPQSALESSDTLCMDYWTSGNPCVAYSFSLDGKDAVFLDSTLSLGFEVHRFDPSRRLRHSGGSGLGSIQHHQAWLDWRRPHARPHRGVLGTVPRRLADIMASLGHRTVDVVRADLESAEWRVLESWVQDGTLGKINQLILTVHLQWAGFEVGGTEVEVVRFWYSILKALHNSGLHLAHSTYGPGHTVLRHELPGTHSSYTLSWVRTREHL